MTLNSDIGARVRAARVYARLEAPELAAEVRAAGFAFSKRTLDRVEAGNRHLDVREAQIIASATSVPLTFLTRGWWAPADLPERASAFEDELASARERIARLEAGAIRAETERDALRTALETVGRMLRDRLGFDLEEAPAQGRGLASGVERPPEEHRSIP